MSVGTSAPLQDNTLGEDAFARVMAPFAIAAGARIAVAVSGGADSMALTRLLSAWAGAHGVNLAAVTVDHRLRAEAAAEARQVAGWLEPLGIAHTTLIWEQGAQEAKGRSLQKAARDARYGLMAAWCAAEGRSHLFLAHHADDQVETFLIRLTRGSGVSGLAAMMPATTLGTAGGSVVLARPLLGFAKADLLAVCRTLNQPWIEDPSNTNTASARVRFRQAARLLEEEGLTRGRLLETVGHMQRARGPRSGRQPTVADRHRLGPIRRRASRPVRLERRTRGNRAARLVAIAHRCGRPGVWAAFRITDAHCRRPAQRPVA